MPRTSHPTAASFDSLTLELPEPKEEFQPNVSPVWKFYIERHSALKLVEAERNFLRFFDSFRQKKGERGKMRVNHAKYAPSIEAFDFLRVFMDKLPHKFELDCMRILGGTLEIEPVSHNTGKPEHRQYLVRLILAAQ